MTPTDKPMTVDALIENTRLAWYLGQRYWQQADSESYAENRRSDLTLEKFNKLLESGRAAIEQYGREQREAAATSKQVEDCVPAPPFDPVAEPPWHRSDMGPAGRGSGEPVAVEPIIDAYLDGYETAYDEGSSAPDADTKFVIKDAIMGLLADDEFVKAVTPQPREPLTDEQMARLFHDTYERLAPSFGYETRPETKAFDPESPNGRLMIAVIHNIRSEG